MDKYYLITGDDIEAVNRLANQVSITSNQWAAQNALLNPQQRELEIYSTDFGDKIYMNELAFHVLKEGLQGKAQEVDSIPQDEEGVSFNKVYWTVSGRYNKH